jgi:hypothetical protein
MASTCLGHQFSDDAIFAMPLNTNHHRFILPLHEFALSDLIDMGKKMAPDNRPGANA